jgi:phage terminase large subunit GpA-like protein
MTVAEWCEANLHLTAIQTDMPGRYSTLLTPYVREVLECFADATVEEISLCWGAQTSKTMTLMAALCWWLNAQPSPCMWVMPNKDLAQSFSENRLQPLFAACAALMATKTRDRHRWKKTEMAFEDAVLNLNGSNSPANLASRPARLLVMDETDKFAEAPNREANALELAEMRTRTFASPKVVKTSTPSTPEGPIWQAFLSGDMRRYFLPCPHCGGEVVLVLDSARSALPRTGCEAMLLWDSAAKGKQGWDYARVEATAHFLCPHCQGRIEDRHKTQMLRAGRWTPTNPNAAPGVRSYHLSTFYAPWRKTAWGRIAVDFLRAKASLEGLKGFVNGSLAEPDMNLFDGGASGRRERVVTESTPLVEPVRILTADVQQDHFWWVVRDWVPGGDSRLVEHGRCELFDDLRAIQQRLNVPENITGLDSGYNASEVYSECARYGWFALRGDPRQSWPHRVGKKVSERPFTVRMFDPFIGKREQGKRKIAELRWSNPSVKDMLARLRDGESSPVRWEVPEQWATEEYFRHLDGEYKTRRFNARTGRVTYEWIMRNRHWPNHLLDCEAMQVAVAMKLGILRMRVESSEDA